MSKKKLSIALAAGIFAVGATAGTAAAGPPAGNGGGGQPAGIACQRAGISTLQALGLLPAVASDGIDVVGIGAVPFKTVLSLHRTNPELFQAGGVSVDIPGVGTVAATWCN